MTDSGSDGEFERFLQEDDDSLSPEPNAYRSKPLTSYSSPSAFSVKSAAGVLLASSKVIKRQTRSKSSDKKRGSKKISNFQLSDSEEALPSYYDEYTTGRKATVEETDADPYAFDIPSSMLPSSATKHENRKKKNEDTLKKKTKGLKSNAKKVAVKSAVISMEERIAKILQRTGSTQFQENMEQEDDGKDVTASSQVDTKTGLKDDNILFSSKTTFKVDKEAKKEIADSENSSNFLDSLGIESADFEVCLPTPQPRAERARLSISSLDSEKFAVNRDALDIKLATPPRYEQQPMAFLKSEEDEESTSENDNYEDDFELDNTLMESQGLISPHSRAQDESAENMSENLNKSSVSGFDKTKTLLLGDSRPALEDQASRQSTNVVQEDQKFDKREPEVDISRNSSAQRVPLDASDTFGYGDEDFEGSGSSGKARTEAQEDTRAIVDDVKFSSDYDDDAFDADLATLKEPPSRPVLETNLATTENEHVTVVDTTNNDSVIGTSFKMDALLAKYGDFYKLDADNEPTTTKCIDNVNAEAMQRLQSMDTSEKMVVESREITSSPATGLANVTVPTAIPKSPPLSPPPPPPPADDDEEEKAQELQRYTLDTPGIDSKSRVLLAAVDHSSSSVSKRLDKTEPSSGIDRFRRIENHVASLRFIQSVTAPNVGIVNSPSQASVLPVSSKTMTESRDMTSVVGPPVLEPLANSFDIDDVPTQDEIHEFVRSSQTLRREKQAAMQRATGLREKELVLRLQQAQRQILQLKEYIVTTTNDPSRTESDFLVTSKVAVKDKDMHEMKQSSVALGTEVTKVSQADYLKLEKEIKTQDTLIAGFQKENERLMQQLKQVRQDVQYNVHEANEELRRQIQILHDQAREAVTLGGGGDVTSKAQYRVAVEARLEAEAHALALQEELGAARLLHQQKVNEITLELDRVKKAKRELECRYEGVDLIKVAEEAQQARELENKLELCKKEHAHALEALQKKLDWYVENQRLLDDQDEELKRLKRQVAVQSVEPKTETKSKDQRTKTRASGLSPYRRSPNDIRRIQELESRLTELEEAMRRRHPDSLSNLILASRRADEEAKARAVAEDYEKRLAAVSHELEQAQEESETKLASFRQRQEKLLLQFRQKIKEQEKQIKLLSNKAPMVQRVKSKDFAKNDPASDAEVAKIRRFYTDKIKELERKWEAKYCSLRKQRYAGSTKHHKAQDGLTYVDSAVIIANLQRQLRETERELKQEKTKVEQLHVKNRTEKKSLPAENVETQHESEKALQAQVADLKAQLKDSESVRAKLAYTLSTVQTLDLARPSNTDTKSTSTSAATDSIVGSETIVSQAEVALLREELALAHKALNMERATATERINQVEKKLAEEMEKRVGLEPHLDETRRELQSQLKLTIELERDKKALEAQAQRIPQLEEDVLSLRRELELPRTPSMVEYRSLELKVVTLEQKHKMREAELKVVLDRALTSTRLEKLSLERAHQAAIATKNAEIASFKHQLEEILNELAQLQQPPSSSWSRPTRPHENSLRDDFDD